MTDPALIDLVGRMLMVGFEGQTLTPALRDLLLEVRPGGIILFERNVSGGPEQIAGLIRAAQDLALAAFGRRLLVAVDQEGGPVRRLGPPFTLLPSQREMARNMTPDQVRALAARSGRELAGTGFNLNLAPVLDLQTDPQARYMAERSFGSDPDLAARLGLAVIQGHAGQGVLTCAKHFPGLGDVRLDPHQDLPTVHHGPERLRSVEMVPFARAVARGLNAVMTAHVRFPRLDPDWPATLSSRLLTEVLRGEMGFTGLILSDDLEMGAVVKNYGLGPAAVQSFRAGCDLLLVCHRPDRITEVREALLQAVRTGEVAPLRVEQSAARLEAALTKCPRPDPGAWPEVLGGN